MTGVFIVKEIILVGVREVRLKLFRLNQTSPKASTRQGAEGGRTHALPPAMQGEEKHDCSTLAEIYNFYIKHGF